MIDPVSGITGIERNFFQDIGQSYQSLATRRVSLSKFLDLRGHMWSFPLGPGAVGWRWCRGGEVFLEGTAQQFLGFFYSQKHPACEDDAVGEAGCKLWRIHCNQNTGVRSVEIQAGHFYTFLVIPFCPAWNPLSRLHFLALPGGCNDIWLRWGGWVGGDQEEAVYGGLLLMAGYPPTYPLP